MSIFPEHNTRLRRKVPRPDRPITRGENENGQAMPGR